MLVKLVTLTIFLLSFSFGTAKSYAKDTEPMPKPREYDINFDHLYMALDQGACLSAPASLAELEVAIKGHFFKGRPTPSEAINEVWCVAHVELMTPRGAEGMDLTSARDTLNNWDHLDNAYKEWGLMTSSASVSTVENLTHLSDWKKACDRIYQLIQESLQNGKGCKS